MYLVALLPVRRLELCGGHGGWGCSPELCVVGLELGALDDGQDGEGVRGAGGQVVHLVGHVVHAGVSEHKINFEFCAIFFNFKFMVQAMFFRCLLEQNFQN